MLPSVRPPFKKLYIINNGALEIHQNYFSGELIFFGD
jgi:hypothetical protein